MERWLLRFIALALFAVAIAHSADYWLSIAVFNFSSVAATLVIHVVILAVIVYMNINFWKKG